MIKLNKNSLEIMPNLLDEIHDRYFHFGNIVFDKDSGEWKLPLGEKRKHFFGKVIVSKVLKVVGVTHYHCNDITGIGQNSINEVHIDLDAGTIDIECNAPAEVKVWVNPDFEMFLENTKPKDEQKQ